MDTEHAVAVVGIACRFPGVENLEDYWRVLVNGENHIREIPDDRWSKDAFYSRDRNEPGKTYAKHAGTIDNILDWDNKLFGINVYEAETMDPQQKLALEVTYRAFENGGFTMESISGSQTAVFMGVMNADYAGLLGSDLAFSDNYTATGLGNSILANRVSFVFNLHGPSVTLDTACSSSMTAQHLGAQSILSGESNMAVCGGVTVLMSPTPFVNLSKARMASESGQCKTYSAEADGYVRSEGCGILILKDLKMAREDGDYIWGIVTSNSNSDGKACTPMTAPSSEMQASLMRTAVKRVKIEASQIDFVEMHGTGTLVGDPAESSSVGKVMGAARKASGLPPCPVGSVKTNLGHLEAAAGAAGAIKVLLMMKYGKIAPSILFGKFNPNLNLEQLHLDVVLKPQDWPYKAKYKIASVNCFGFGGSNIHSIYQSEQEDHLYLAGKDISDTEHVVLFTGRDKKSVLESMEDTRLAIQSGNVSSLKSLGHTSCYFRTLYQYRKAVTATSLNDLCEKLKSMDKAVQSLQSINQAASKEKNIVMVFCGMGSHWAGMGLEMYKTNSVFKKTIDELHAIFWALGQIGILECLKGDKDLTNPLFGQPALFACQAALYMAWVDKGVVPNAIVGHSVGEVAAAFASGCLSLKEAAEVVYIRGSCVSQAKGGKMLVVGKLALNEILSEIEPYKGKVDVAAFNSQTSVTLSGDTESIVCLEKQFNSKFGDSIFVRLLEVQVAYHSFYMDDVLNDLSSKISRKLRARSNSIQTKKHISTVTGEEISLNDARTPGYWRNNVRKSVLFSRAFSQTLSSDHLNVVIEIGPRPALRSNIKENGKQFALELLPSMHVSNEKLFNQSLEKCFELGASKRPEKQRQSICFFPRYAFQRSRVYKEPLQATQFREGKSSFDSTAHPFVQKVDEEGHKKALVSFEPNSTPFVFEHKLSNMVIVPGATYVEMGFATMKCYSASWTDCTIEASVKFLKPGVISGTKGQMQVTMFEENSVDSLHTFHVTVDDVMHASGTVSKSDTTAHCLALEDLSSLRSRMKSQFNPDIMYEKLAKYNFTYGPSLRCIESGYMNDSEVLVTVSVPPKTNLKNTTVHPVVLDTILQISVSFPAMDQLQDGQMIPFGIDKIFVYSPLRSKMLLHVKISEIMTYGTKMSAALMTETGEIIVQCFGLTYGIMGKFSNFDPKEALFQMAWRETELPSLSGDANAKPLILVSQGTTTISFDDGSPPVSKNMPFDGQLGMKIHHVGLKDLLKEKLLDDHMELSSVLPADLNEFGGVIYFPNIGKEFNTEEITGDTLQKFVFESCFPLLQLIKYIISTDVHIPVFLVTSGVYQLFSLQDTEAQVNTIIAASLVGSARSINKELPFLSCKSIDIGSWSEENIRTLRKVILSKDDYPEVAIYEGKYIVGALLDSPNKHMKPQFQYYYSNDELVELKRGSKGQFSTEVTERPKYNARGYEKVKTLQAVLPNDEKYPLATKHHMGDKDHTLIASDFIVQMPSGTKGSVYAIQNVASELLVRKSHVVSFDTFPCTVPCLSYWLDAFTVVQDLDQKCTYLLAAHSSDIIQTYALKCVCQLRKINISETYDKNTDYGGVIVISNDTEWANNQLGVYGEKYLSVHLLLTGKQTDAAVFANPMVHVINTYQTLMCNAHLQSLPAFLKWLPSLKRDELQTALGQFCNLFESRIQTVDFHHLSTFVKEQGIHTLLKFDGAWQRSDLKCFSNKTVFRKKASYVVVGGSKGLGWQVVKHIASSGAGHIYIVSRSGLNKEKLLEVKRLEMRYDCKILDMKADVADIAAVEHVFKTIKQRKDSNPLRGIFFGAVLSCDSLLLSMTMDKFKVPLGPKVAGIWNVYTLTKDVELDFFVIHSSIASLFGNAGQTNYGAGNAFQDAVACLRHIRTGVGLSICWGALDLGILQDNEQAKKKVQAMGLIPLKPEEIVQCLDFAMGLIKEPVLCLSNFSWKTWSRWMANSSLLVRKQYTPLIERHCHFMKSSSPSAKSTLEGGSAGLEYAKELLKQLLFVEGEDISMQSTLIDLGADSHQIQLFHSKMTGEFGVSSEKIPVVKLGQMPLSEIFDLVSPATSAQSNETQKPVPYNKTTGNTRKETTLPFNKANEITKLVPENDKPKKLHVNSRKQSMAESSASRSSSSASDSGIEEPKVDSFTTHEFQENMSTKSSTAMKATHSTSTESSWERYEGGIFVKRYTNLTAKQISRRRQVKEKIELGIVRDVLRNTKYYDGSGTCSIM